MPWLKKNSHKEFDNEKKFLRLEDSPPPPAPHNFSNGPSLSAAGLAQSVKRLTAEREVWGSITEAGPILRVLNNREIKALSFPCKWLDLRAARMTM